MEVTIQKIKSLQTVTEKLQTISHSVYIQWGIVLSMLALTAFFVEFRVSTLAAIEQLEKATAKQEQKLDYFEKSYPNKEWLEAKLESIRLEIKQSQTVK